MNQIAAPAIPSDTIEGLVALADQLDAAVDDVWQAWSTFLYGPAPVGDRAVPVPQQDRICRTSDYLNGNISRLREIAVAIRQRA